MKHMRFFSLIFVCFSYILSLLLNSNSSYSLKHTKPRIRDGGMGGGVVEIGTKLLETSAQGGAQLCCISVKFLSC